MLPSFGDFREEPLESGEGSRASLIPQKHPRIMGVGEGREEGPAALGVNAFPLSVPRKLRQGDSGLLQKARSRFLGSHCGRVLGSPGWL